LKRCHLTAPAFDFVAILFMALQMSR
jgi:hypothetical protein